MKIQYTAIACLTLLAFAFSACDDDDSNEGGSTKSYLPLKIGNYWEFITTPEVGSYTQRTDVTRVASVNNNEYFELVNTYQSGDQVSYDTTYYRITHQGYVYIWKKNWTVEENPMRLYADDGDTWTYVTNYDEVTEITTSIDDEEIGNKTLRKCKTFSFDIAEWVDEEYSTVLAPGIGFVKGFSGWGISSELTKASINGKVYTF